MISIIMQYVWLVFLCFFILYAFIWAFIGLKCFLDKYRSENSELYLFEISVLIPGNTISYEYRYYANSQRMALNKYYAEYHVSKDTKIVIRQLDKKSN